MRVNLSPHMMRSKNGLHMQEENLGIIHGAVRVRMGLPATGLSLYSYVSVLLKHSSQWLGGGLETLKISSYFTM